MLYLNAELKKFFSNSDPFEILKDLNGTVYRQVQTRKTFRFEHNGKSYFAKVHTGVGWIEIFKNFIQFKKPILGARDEWTALNFLKQIPISTMNVVAYGEKGWNPAKLKSFVITEELKQTISLEDYCLNWLVAEPSLSIRRSLIREVANFASAIHAHGVCHRDLYLCHFLLHKDGDYFPKLSLIDLHRALLRKKLPKRWIIKDIAGLYYSAMGIGLSKRDLLRFIRQYTILNEELAYRANRRFWKIVESKADSMHKKLGTAR